MDQLVGNRSLIEVCGLQWRACVQAADAAVEQLPVGLGITLRYEDLVSDPISAAKHLFARLGLAFMRECQVTVEREVQADHVDQWRSMLSSDDLRYLMPHIEAELLHHGYAL
jgi:hypothetical protein